MDDRIPFSRPYIGLEERYAVGRVMDTKWLTIGKEVGDFEHDLGRFCGANHVIATDSCTSALTIALRALAHKLRNERPRAPLVAMVPALTFVATANAAVHAGYNVAFCDVNKSGNIDVDKLREHPVFPAASVIVPVHFAGSPCDLYSLWETGIPIIEDAAHALGAKYHGRTVGSNSPSIASCFSFYPTKTITTIEGGAITTSGDDTDLLDCMRALSLHGLGMSHANRYKRSSLTRPVVGEYGPGYKANMTDIEAAFGREQLKKMDFILTRRRQYARLYADELRGHVEFLDTQHDGHAWHIFVILVDNRNVFASRMTNAGIGVGFHYSPIIPAHPYYRTCMGHYEEGDFPVAEMIASRCVSLPLYPELTEEQLFRVIKTVKESI